jgi:hypothetical protein
MKAIVSRQYLLPPYSNDLVVMRMRAPTFANTQAGDPPYLATSSRQVRFWSVCEDDPLTSGVNRCIEDNQAINTNGFITIVMSDPSKKPADSTLALYGAEWMSWGALQNGDTLYDVNLNPVTNTQPVYYYGGILYRQTLPNPSWNQSIAYVSANYPNSQWQTVMGDYWPSISYCTLSSFTTLGAACTGN